MVWLDLSLQVRRPLDVRNLRRAPEQRANLVKTFLTYLSCEVTPLDNISFRAACVDDIQGEHIGIKTREAGTGS
jgi:hypothetical protein